MALTAEAALLTRVVIVFPVIVTAPEPTPPVAEVSIAVDVTATYDKMF